MTPPRKFSPPGSARLFGEPHAQPPSGVHTAHIDGASRGNPGAAAYAVIVRDPSGRIIFQLGKKFGRDTNNVAEYYGLLAALDYAATHAISALRIRSDSELLVRQMQGRYKVKSPDLQPLYERASRLARQIAYLAFEHVPREMNREADALANAALDAAGDTATSASEPAHGRGESLRVRARFSRGVFVPTEAVDVPEGAEVVLKVEVREKRRP